MTVKLGEHSVTVTEGRGKNKSVILDVSLKDLEVWAARSGKDAAQLWRRSYGRAVSGLKKQFTKIVTSAGGVYGVPKFRNFEQFTRELRTVTNRTTPMGGTLADKRRIVAYKQNGWQIIGWPDTLANTAVAFQDGEGGRSAEDWLNNPRERAWLHRRGLRDIPRVYTHNPRRILPEPFGTHVRNNLDNWAKSIYFKQLASLMAKNAKGAAK